IKGRVGSGMEILSGAFSSSILPFWRGNALCRLNGRGSPEEFSQIGGDQIGRGRPSGQILAWGDAREYQSGAHSGALTAKNVRFQSVTDCQSLLSSRTQALQRHLVKIW